MIYKSGHIYEGNWSNNERNGFGKMTYKVVIFMKVIG